MSKNKNRRFESNLLDRAPVAEEGHVESEATANEPTVSEPEVVTKETEPAVEAPAEKPDHGFYEEKEPRTYGVVNSKCKKLNVREAADPTARVVSIINSGKKIRIKKNESTDKFYKVSLETGVSGFVMKEFIDEV